ncbi:MAG: hypothetical protein RH917_18740 [Lacipirellulaceae bacterium]
MRFKLRSLLVLSSILAAVLAFSNYRPSPFLSHEEQAIIRSLVEAHLPADETDGLFVKSWTFGGETYHGDPESLQAQLLQATTSTSPGLLESFVVRNKESRLLRPELRKLPNVFLAPQEQWQEIAQQHAIERGRSMTFSCPGISEDGKLALVYLSSQAPHDIRSTMTWFLLKKVDDKWETVEWRNSYSDSWLSPL